MLAIEKIASLVGFTALHAVIGQKINQMADF